MNTTPPTPSPIKITAETQPDDYMKAIVCIGHWDLHHHNLLSACRSVIVARRAFSTAQSAVPTEALDKLEEVMALKTPDWPKPTVTPDAPLPMQGVERLSVRQHLATATTALAAILADTKEKNDMIDAGETHGAEWAMREDDLGECQQILEEMSKSLDRLDYLL